MLKILRKLQLNKSAATLSLGDTTSLGDTSLKATTFLYNVQQPTKRIDKSLIPCEKILNAIEIEEGMVIIKYAKPVVRQKLERTQLKSESEKPSTST